MIAHRWTQRAMSITSAVGMHLPSSQNNCWLSLSPLHQKFMEMVVLSPLLRFSKEKLWAAKERILGLSPTWHKFILKVLSEGNGDLNTEESHFIPHMVNYSLNYHNSQDFDMVIAPSAAAPTRLNKQSACRALGCLNLGCYCIYWMYDFVMEASGTASLLPDRREGWNYQIPELRHESL